MKSNDSNIGFHINNIFGNNLTCLTATSNRQKFNAEKSSRSIRFLAEKPLPRDFHANLLVAVKK